MNIDPTKVGKITKIRLEHDNGGAASGWRVEKVVLQDLLTPDQEQLEFPLTRWLCDDEDDGDVVREVAARWPGEEPLPGGYNQRTLLNIGRRNQISFQSVGLWFL